MKVFLLALFLLLAASRSPAVELSYRYSGEIVAAQTAFQGSSPFDPLEGRAFSGSFTFDSDDLSSFSPGMSNFYPATSADFLIDGANFVQFTSFDWPPLIVDDNGLFLSADTSATTGHVADWTFEGVDVGESIVGVYLSFFESGLPETIIEKLNEGTLTATDFTETGIWLSLDGVLVPFTRYLNVQVVEQTGPDPGDFQIHEIHGDITFLAIPEPASGLLLAAGLVAIMLHRRVH
jgi:hypothetical protein